MGRVFLIKFDQIPENELYVCSKCRTHIAVERERSGLHHEHGNELNGAIFRNAINWHTLGAEQNRRVGDYVIAEVYCNNCGNRLGFQFTDGSRFYVCRECQDNIALFLEHQYRVLGDPELYGSHFEKVVNVHTRGSEHNRKVADFVVADVYCNRCDNLLGTKLIDVANRVGVLKNGHFLLHMPKLLLWNGTEKVDAQQA